MTPTHRAEAHESELAALTAGIEEALASNCDGITAFVPVELLHGLLHELAARATPPTEPVAGVAPRVWVSLHRRPSTGSVLQADVCWYASGETLCVCDGDAPERDAQMIADALNGASIAALEAAAVPTSAAVPVEVVTLNDAAFALRMALRDMEAIHCPVPESSALVGYFCNRLRAALATLQAAEPAEERMTRAEWERRYFQNGLPVDERQFDDPWRGDGTDAEPAAKKGTAA